MTVWSTSNNYPAYSTYKVDDDDKQTTPDNSSRFGGDYSSDLKLNDAPPQSRNNAPPRSNLQRAPVDPANTPVTESLPGVTAQELSGLFDRYDSESSSGTSQSRNLNNDQTEKDKLNAASELDYTGFPSDVARFEKGVGDTRTRLAALPPDIARHYASQLAVFEAAYCSITSQEARSVIEHKAAELQDAILQEYNRSINDPLDRALSIFNHPLGEGYLDASYAKQLAQLDDLREAFLTAPDAAAREKLFRQAADVKNKLQQAVSEATDAYLKTDHSEWNDANKFVDQTLQDAQNIQDPVKRYKSINDALFSFNTGMGEDPVADKRVLAFTQRIRNDADLRHKLDLWQIDAHNQLKSADDPNRQPAALDPNHPDNKNQPAPVPSYSRIADNPPPAGPDYIRDLADRYTQVGQQITKTEILAAGGRPYGPPKPSANTLAALEAVFKAIARTLLGLTPLAALKHPWSPDTELESGKMTAIESTVNILLAVLDPVLRGLGDLIKDGGEGVQFARELGEEVGMTAGKIMGKSIRLIEKDGHLSPEENGGGASGGKSEKWIVEPVTKPAAGANPDASVNTDGSTPPYRPVSDGPSEDPRILAAKARLHGKSMQIPEDYAAHIDDPSTLTADENAPGIYNNDHGEHFIKGDDKYYRVNYDSSENTWRVINPSPGRYSYPVKFEPTGAAWSINTDVGLKGGGPLSRLVSLKKFAQDPRIAKLVNSKMLKPQNPQTCFLDHATVAKDAADVPDGRLVPVSNGPLNAAQLRKELDKGPLVLSARDIARADSDYSGMHTVVLLKIVKEDGKDYVLGIDLDDTIRRIGSEQNLKDGDFGGVEYDLDRLTREATPYTDEDTHAQLEMYHRPEQSKGIWEWFKEKFGGSGSKSGEGGSDNKLSLPNPPQQPAPPESRWVPDTCQAKPDSELNPDPANPGIFRDGNGRAFIKQGEKTYTVIYDKDNATWRVSSPEGGTKPSYAVRLKSDGTWELNGNVGLPGGAPSNYTDALGADIYADRVAGMTLEAIAQKYGISSSAAPRYLRTYEMSHPDLPPTPYGK